MIKFSLKNGHAAQRNLLSFSTFDFKLFWLLKEPPRHCSFVFLWSYQLSPTQLSVSLVGERLSPRGRAVIVVMGMGSTEHLIYWVGQLINIKAWLIFHRRHRAATWSTALGSTDVSWRGGGRQKRTGSREDGNNWDEREDEMRWVRQKKGGGESEKDGAEVHKPQWKEL